ncbi:hypothetical protein [Myroides marinus]|uniref:hypothetical protein n=1 Tax=Myroides marinus TaxID=703342 RepID=UPI0025776548|nr:hypothetical protein [Myroides marinus]MDM1404504.1 hypothetical protein [Myroides marinus]MDM1534233.1 hypothetical protein [Myroides marinus]MDM1541197.1 hypothetical protein [Myroides marinus]
MNTKEFYSVLVPLINLILTGKKEVTIEDDCIKLSEGYKFSMEEYAHAKQSTHFYRCIFEFLEHLNQQQKVDVVKIIVENDVLLTTAILTDLIESKKTINGNQDNEAEFNKMMFEFLTGINTHSVIYKVLYMYLENLHRLEIKEFAITKREYERGLKFNAQERNNEDILNMFII